MIDNNFELTKENLDLYLKAVAKEYKKLNRKGIPAEIIIVGGASILINYSFRLSTTDIDAYTQASSNLKDAINYVADKYDLPNGWLNSDFRMTDSFSEKIFLYSKHYKTFYNIFNVRSVSREYLIAMKMRSGRKYRNDLSDIIGILAEHMSRNDPISLEEIQKAYVDLYGDLNSLSKETADFITSIYSSSDVQMLYQEIKKRETDSKTMLIEFDTKYPGITNESNVNLILETLRKREQEK